MADTTFPPVALASTWLPPALSDITVPATVMIEIAKPGAETAVSLTPSKLNAGNGTTDELDWLSPG